MKNHALLISTLGLCLFSVSSSGFAAPPPGGTPDTRPSAISEREVNNTFAQRNVLLANNTCKARFDFAARLGPRDTGHPDTVLGFFDIIGLAVEQDPPADTIEPVVALDTSPEAEAMARQVRAAALQSRDSSGTRGILIRNDDGGPYARWGGSELAFLREGPFGSRFRITGKGCDPLAFGLPCTHNQFGGYEVFINWYAPMNVFIGQTVFFAALNSNDTDEFVLTPPAGTFDFDILTKTISDYTGDVDFFEVQALRPNELYTVSTTGDHARFDRTLDTILGEYNAGGARIITNDDIGFQGSPPNQFWNRNSSFTIRADGAGRIRVAVTGWNDFSFNGIEDGGQARHDESGPYILTVTHFCPLGCLDANNDCEVNFPDITEILRNFARRCQ